MKAHTWLSHAARTTRAAVRMMLTAAPGPTGEGPRVWYGGLEVPRATDTAHGGIVKLQRMQPLFPDTARRFNLLYMVSSRMPDGAAWLARRARRKGARVVWNQNGVAYPAWHGPGWETTNAPMAAVLHEADHVFYQSRFCRDSSDRYLGRRRGPSEILYNAVDTARFAPAAESPSGLTLLLGGSQYQRYRLRTALDVLERVSRERADARLLVTGRLSWTEDAIARGEANQWAAERGVADRVTFHGSYSQDEAPRVFHGAHLLLHTKVNDPSPGLVVEAMACGLPVVYPSSGGVPELVGEDAGIGVADESTWDADVPPDTDALARAVLAVADRLPAYAEAARRRAVDMFDLHPWLQRHRAIFERLIQC